MSVGQKRRKTRSWVRRQQKDIYVRQATLQGVRARSYFKLAQIDRQYQLIRSTSKVVDLGSSPGGWSQYVISRVTSFGRVVAMDILPMESLPGVHFVQGDVHHPEACEEVMACLGQPMTDLVLSDMAPNITGIRSADEANMGRILTSVFVFCARYLCQGGAVLIKLFEGEMANFGRCWMKVRFEQMHTIKPDASRAKSQEFYLLGRGYRGVVSEGNMDTH